MIPYFSRLPLSAHASHKTVSIRKIRRMMFHDSLLLSHRKCEDSLLSPLGSTTLCDGDWWSACESYLQMFMKKWIEEACSLQYAECNDVNSFSKEKVPRFSISAPSHLPHGLYTEKKNKVYVFDTCWGNTSRVFSIITITMILRCGSYSSRSRRDLY